MLLQGSTSLLPSKRYGSNRGMVVLGKQGFNGIGFTAGQQFGQAFGDFPWLRNAGRLFLQNDEAIGETNKQTL